MRILYFLIFGISLAVLNGCNDSSTSNDSADNTSAGSPVTTDTDTTAGMPNNVGFLQQLADRADALLVAEVTKLEQIHGADTGIPHIRASLKVEEVLAGEIETFGTDEYHVTFVGGTWNDGSGRSTVSSESPENMAEGKRYVLSARERDTPPSTIDFGHRGLFELTADGLVVTESGKAIVVDENRKVSYVSKGGRDSRKFDDVLTKSSHDRFISLMRDLANRSSFKNERMKLVRKDPNAPFYASPSLTQASPGPLTNDELDKQQAEAKRILASRRANETDREHWERKMYEKYRSPVIPESYPGQE